MRNLLVYRTETWKTTWLLRLLLALGTTLLLLATKTWWAPALGGSVVYKGPAAEGDVVLIDNLEADYRLFDRTGRLQRRGTTSRVLVPVAADDHGQPSPVERAVVEVMATMARLENVELVPYRAEEPISLNAARQLLPYLQKTDTHAILVVSPGFRSERSYRVYASVLGPAGIQVSCVPVFGTMTPDNWTQSWHGVQDVLLQVGKLWYYRLVIGF